MSYPKRISRPMNAAEEVKAWRKRMAKMTGRPCCGMTGRSISRIAAILLESGDVILTEDGESILE